MAGGPNAQKVVCFQCLTDEGELTPATRIYEGIEDDHYRCERGHAFGICWDHSDPPTSPQWPPSEEDRAMLEHIRKSRRST